MLVSSSGDTVGAMVYTTGNRPGFSEEKIDPEGGDGPDNWMDSRWEGGTPGRANSVSPRDYDLALARVSESPFPVPAGVSRDFVLAVENRGRLPASVFSVAVEGISGWRRDFPGLGPAEVTPDRNANRNRTARTARIRGPGRVRCRRGTIEQPADLDGAWRRRARFRGRQ